MYVFKQCELLDHWSMTRVDRRELYAVAAVHSAANLDWQVETLTWCVK
jgi:hypothetical protein